MKMTERQIREARYLEALLEWFETATDEQIRQTFVEAGIVDESGELTEGYGGNASPEDVDE